MRFRPERGMQGNLKDFIAELTKTKNQLFNAENKLQSAEATANAIDAQVTYTAMMTDTMLPEVTDDV